MYIAFEGIDGSGKTTQIQMLGEEELFKSYSTDSTVAYVKEPYYFCSEMYPLLHHKKYNNNATQLLLFLSCHAEFVTNFLDNTITRYKHFVSDRSIYSTYAYTAGYDEHLAKKAKNIVRMLGIEAYPNIVFYLKSSYENVKTRSMKRNVVQHYNDVIENQTKEFYQRVLQAYDNLIRDSPSKWYVFDANESPEKIHNQIMLVLLKEISENGFSKLVGSSSNS